MAAAECHSRSGGFYGERNEDLFKTEAAEPDTGSKVHEYLMKMRSNEDKVSQLHLSKKLKYDQFAQSTVFLENCIMSSHRISIFVIVI